MDATSIKERRLTCYPQPKYSLMIRAYAEIKDISDSEAGSEAIKYLIDNLPPHEKEKVIAMVHAKSSNKSKNSY